VQDDGASRLMSAFEPLIRISRTAYPYWLIAALLLSLLTGFVARRKNRDSFLAATIAQMGTTCVFLFVILGVYVQVTGNAMSFTELLPASFVVALGWSVSLLILVWSKEKVGLGMSILTLVLPTVVFTPFLSFALIIFPPFVAAHFR
jgi:hypothetical protein